MEVTKVARPDLGFATPIVWDRSESYLFWRDFHKQGQFDRDLFRLRTFAEHHGYPYKNFYGGRSAN